MRAYKGVVENGVVVVVGARLPEGTVVTVTVGEGELLRAQITHFFEQYKALEKGKWVKVEGWDNAEAAKAEIISSFERAQKK